MIHDKPFAFGEMLRRTIFLSRPNFFNAVDLNKEMSTIHNFMEEFNKKFAVSSKIKFSFNTFGETQNTSTTPITVSRTFHINWTEEPILFKGVQFDVPAGGTSFTHSYPLPNSTVSPKEVKPPTYIVLFGALTNVNYSDNPALCGLTADETPTSVPSVEVEQYQNVTIGCSKDLTESNIIAVLATIHPRYKTDGTADGFGLIMNTFNNDVMIVSNGLGNAVSENYSNGTLFDYITEKLTNRYSNIINETQLMKRFNLADLENASNARANIGFDQLVNRRQLVQGENLYDLTDKERARFNLGLGNAAIKNVGTTINDVARGDIIQIGTVVLWWGAPSAIPSGWKECNGSDGTPNLRGRVAVGYDPTNNDYLMGSTGGAERVKLTGAQSGLLAHTHTATSTPHSHEIGVDGFNGSAGGSENRLGNTFDGSRFTDAKTVGITVNEVPAQPATDFHENRQPYLALMYIIYTGNTITPPTPLTPSTPLTYPNFSTPTTGSTGTDGGYSQYDFNAILNAGRIDLGAGVILTNPE